MRANDKHGGYALVELIQSMAALTLALVVCVTGTASAARVIMYASIKTASDAYADDVAAAILAELRSGNYDSAFDDGSFDDISPPLYVCNLHVDVADEVVKISFTVVMPRRDDDVEIFYEYRAPLPDLTS